MKRIAIQLFGHLRTFRETFPSFEQNVLEPNRRDGYEVDIFIHTWDEVEHNTVSYRNPDGFGGTKAVTQQVIDEVQRLYQPRKLLVEPQRQIEELVFLERIAKFKRSVRGVVNVTYTTYMANQLRLEHEQASGAQYDWVIVTRPDIQFLAKFQISDLLEIYEREGFSIPENAIYYGCRPFGRGNKAEDPRFITASDIIFFATPAVINQATRLYEFWESKFDKDDFWCVEQWWYNHWKEEHLLPIPIKYHHGLEFEMIRDATMLRAVWTEGNKKGRFFQRAFRLVVKVLPYFIAKKLLK